LDAVVVEGALFFLHGFAWPVAYVLAGAWDEAVEYDAFAYVGVSD
jgi:hypothetical protein